MMGERLPRAGLLVCSAGLAVMGVALGLSFSAGAPPGNALALLPPLWLWLAALLGRTDPGPAAHGVTAAGVLNLLLGLALLAVEHHRWATGQRDWPGPGVDKLLVVTQFPVALAALALAAVGWWLRRRDRLASGDE